MADGDFRDPLFFLPPSRHELKGEKRPRPQVTTPTPGGQGKRMAPRFAELQNALSGERAKLVGVPDDADPELVAVFDLATTEDAFARAVQKIDGLEFLAGFDFDKVEPDQDFHFQDGDGALADDLVQQSIYMVMTNAAAVDQLISLFQRWQADPKITFDRGLNPLKHVFAHLRDLRRWSTEDRIKETGLLDDWRASVEIAGAQTVRAEVELWFRSEAGVRQHAASAVTGAVIDAGGRVVATAVIGEIGYHGLLVELPRQAAEAVIQEGPEELSLLVIEQVMFVAPVSQFIVELEEEEGPAFSDTGVTPSGHPLVAVLDGVPLAGHDALRGRVIVDDPDDLEGSYSAAQRRHGTAVATLVCHGDLAAGEDPLPDPIYVRPVLVPDEHFAGRERFPADHLPIDLLHRAIHRMQNGDAGGEPAAPSVRIVQLAVGDQSRIFDRRLSPMARLLDHLAHEYNLVFVVSAGNHPLTVQSLEDSEDLKLEGVESRVLASLFRDRRLRRVFSPGEAINALTVGAANTDSSPAPALPDDVVQLVAAPDVPTLYSPVGFGFRSSVKPDVMLPGGRQLHRLSPAGGEAEQVNTSRTGPGLLSAAPGRAGATDSTAYFGGTSGASALATRRLAGIMSGLRSLRGRDDAAPNLPEPQYDPVLARALLVNAASWQGGAAVLREAIPGINRRELTKILGFGAVDPTRCLTATDSRVLIVGAGTITDRCVDTFRLPLPPSLEKTAEWRELRITLAWLSPIESKIRQYRAARLWFEPPTDDEIGVDRVEADWSAAKQGTVQHEVLWGKQAVVYDKDGELAIDISCRIDVGDKKAHIRYGLAVSLEVGPAIQTSVYDEVRTSLIQARGRVAVQPGA